MTWSGTLRAHIDGRDQLHPRNLRCIDTLVVAMLQFDLPRCALFNTANCSATTDIGRTGEYDDAGANQFTDRGVNAHRQ